MTKDIDLFVSAYILAGLTSLLLSASKPAIEALQYWLALLLVIVRRRWKRRGLTAAPFWAFASAIGILIDIYRSSKLAVALARYYGIRRGLTWPGVQLKRLSGPDRASELIVVVPGTWHNPRSVEVGELRDIIAALGVANPHAQVVLARWPSWNKQSARQRAADELATQIKCHIGAKATTVSLVGHSHGWTVATAAAARLSATSLGRVVTLGRPLIVDWPTRYKRGTGNISILAFAAIVISVAGGASFVATTLIQGPFPGISHLGPALMFEGIWAAIFFSMVAGALFFSARASRRITPHMEYECGSKITAIYAAEDILIKGCLHLNFFGVHQMRYLERSRA